MSFINTVIDIWKTYGGSFLYGLGITLIITLFSLLFSTILGLALGYLNSVPRNKQSKINVFLFRGSANERKKKNEYNTCWCDSNYTECSSISF